MTRRINRYRWAHCGCDEPIHNVIGGKLYSNNGGMILDDNSNSALVTDVHGLTLTDEEKETIDAILSMGLERVNPDRFPKGMVHAVIYKALKYVYKKG